MFDCADLSYTPFDSWIGDRRVPTLGTNLGAQVVPFQNWRRFKEAFAPELIARAVRETPGGVEVLGDPFGGSGTSGLAGQFLGAKPQIIEVNPYLADLIQAKLQAYDFDALSSDFVSVMKAARGSFIDPEAFFAGAPATFVEPGKAGRYIFSRQVAGRIAAFRNSIASLPLPEHQIFFRALLGSILIPVSNVLVSGKGRRYRRGWQRRTIDPGQVDKLFEQAVLDAIYDVRRFHHRRCRDYLLCRGDARTAVELLDPMCLAVFSPPYPNSFDYTDVYNVELWGLGYLTSATDNRSLREQTLRSHVQIKRDMQSNVDNSTLKHVIDRLSAATARLWDPLIPGMIGAYFADMQTVMTGLKAKLRRGGRMYMVVGDSRYAGINVPVAQILLEIGEELGFSPVGIEPFRSMRASPQQGGRPELAESLVVLAA